MRQLGARLPVPPPVETDVETPSEILPHERHPVETREAYPVEVHRIERNLIEPTPAIEPKSAVEAKAPIEPMPPVEAERPVEAMPQEPKSTKPVEGLRITEAVEPHSEAVPETTHPLPDPVERPQETTPAGTHRNPPAEPAVPEHGPLPNPRLLVEERATAEVPVGRWEEFHDFRRLEPGRGSRISLEPVPMRQGAPSRLLSADLDDDRRSSFLTLAVPGIAAILALGAIVWSGSLRDRVRQQDTAMSALQEQNQKLADTLAQMSVDQKVSSALDSSANAPSVPQQAAAPAAHPAAAPAPQQAAPSGQPSTPTTGKNEAAGIAPAQNEIGGQLEKQRSGKLQGVSTPPSVGQRGSTSVQQRGSRYRQPVAVGYAPEIVPPYPTNFKSDNVTANAANSQPVPSAGAYRQPFTPGAYQEPVSAAGSSRPQTNAGTTPRSSAPQASTATRLPPPQAANSSAPAAATSNSAAKYSAAGNGPFTSPLAQNIEVVEGLQRHSPVQLREFHARAGTQTQATPNVRLSVQHPDEGRGSYALVVNQGGSSYQLQGQVDRPLVFADAATHREYALVVLNIADQQVYGYVRATR